MSCEDKTGGSVSKNSVSIPINLFLSYIIKRLNKTGSQKGRHSKRSFHSNSNHLLILFVSYNSSVYTAHIVF